MKRLSKPVAAVAVMLVIPALGNISWSAQIFSSRPIWSSGTSISGGDGVARFIDVDRDGDPDIATCAPGPMHWVLYRNEGGNLEKKPFWESAETTDCDHIDVLDFNRDGWMDLAGTHETHCTLYFNKSGKFNTSPDWETAFIADANQISFGDYDGDGDLDMLMAAGRPLNGVGILENKDGTPSRTITQKVGFEEYCETAIWADYDGDGDLDVIAGYCHSGKIVVYLNSKGEFDSGTVVYQEAEHPFTQRVYWEDLDKDGKAELFCGKGPWSGAAASLRLVKVEGSSEMRIVWKSSPRSAFHGFAFGDVDKDGDVDLVAADWGGGGEKGVYLYLSEKGKLPDSPDWSARTPGPAHEVVLGDIDGDGDLDLAVGCQDQAHIYENLIVDKSKE
jgi:hypothetical protein